MRMGLRWCALAVCLVAAAVGSAQYAKQGIRLLKSFDLSEFPGNPGSAAGCYGYVSPSGREYAIIGLRNGNGIVEITDPENAKIVGHVNGPVNLWHETVVMGDFAYAATEGGGGMQIIDLRQVDNGIVSLHTTYTGQGLSSIHTIQANPESKRIYVNGSNIGFAILDCSNPTSPVYLNRWQGSYVHDSIVVNWKEGVHAGKEIAFVFGAQNGLYILDVTNANNIIQLARLYYVSNGYCHSGVLSSDRKTLYINDELDEKNQKVSSATTWIVDIENLSNPTVRGVFQNGRKVTDHNSWIQDDFLVLSCYAAGTLVYDVRDPNNLKETGQYDTYYLENNSFNGNWGVYAGFPSRTVIASDIQSGLFIYDVSEAKDQGAPILSFKLDVGQLNSGGKKELRLEDGNLLVATNAPGLTAETKPTVQLSVTHETNYSPVVTLDVAWKAAVNLASGARSELFLKDQSLGQWVKVGEADLSPSQTGFSVKNIPVGDFVGANGKIESRLKIQSLSPILNSKMTAFVDLVQVKANR